MNNIKNKRYRFHRRKSLFAKWFNRYRLGSEAGRSRQL
jgi:hypothetical protein